MELYIEYVIIDNMVMNYAILKLIDITTGVKISKLNKLLVCGLGTIFAIFLPYLYFNKILLFGYKFVVSIILVLCVKKFEKLRNFMGVYLLFLAYTFLLGGVCFGVINLLGIEYSASNLIMNSFEFPTGLFILVLMIFIWIVKKAILYAKNRLRASNYMYNVTLFDGGYRVSSAGLLDSGNNINFESQGVSIISISMFMKLYREIDLTDIMLRKDSIEGLKNINYISISGIGKVEQYLTFQIDRMEVNGKSYDSPRMALAMKNFGYYDCILHRQFVEGK